MQLSTKLSQFQIDAAALWWKLHLQGILNADDPTLLSKKMTAEYLKLRKIFTGKADTVRKDWPALFEQVIRELLMRQNEYGDAHLCSLDLNPKGIQPSSFLAYVIRELKSSYNIELNIFMFPIQNIEMRFIGKHFIMINEQRSHAASFIQSCMAAELMHRILTTDNIDLSELNNKLKKNKHYFSFTPAWRIFKYFERLKTCLGDSQQEAIKLEMMRYRNQVLFEFDSVAVHRYANETVDDAMIPFYSKAPGFGHSRVTIPFFKPAIIENTASQAIPGNTVKPTIWFSEEGYASDDNLAILRSPR
ncbi:hypothetical protein Lqui_0287 [Legionella quinlivanii]|uniref:Uncharacterized protein n=1 Tax=Legionella quinlivanii TaxID=45073 RepID=A0A0W0Y4K4_9GAMM|nr:hypothetical protein [Legionella quinlivanii]KTD51443.1 hypothetical protein Lqui_0287 [Legionella quinlivanii]MCW8451575.1 hypothetical protein [Legionella quinlivanii]SEG10542.1 hypothetical protein SAMN02746093_01888 [Legionella quinlivanii DSM 21216]STY10203.1 Uncharacterised protein [Legionella quinlivanii]